MTTILSRCSRRFVAVAGLFVALLPISASAAGRNGIDCNCWKTGAYGGLNPGIPMQPVNPDGSSPNAKYRVNVIPGSGVNASLTVTNPFLGIVLLNGVEGVNWGFSPDGDRFVVQSATGSYPNVMATWTIYDLNVNPGPARLVREVNTGSSEAVISFSSPFGTYVLFGWLDGPIVNLLLFDGISGVTSFQTSYEPGVALGSQLSSVWGWGPVDERFFYAYIPSGSTAGSNVNWQLVNLAAGAANQPPGQSLTAVGAGFWFSPCGDAFLIGSNFIPPPGVPTLVNFDLYATSNGTHLAHRDIPLDVAESVLSNNGLIATLAQHVLRDINTYPETDYVLAPNTAPNSCPIPPPPPPPIAAFTPPTGGRALVDLQFTDASTASGPMIMSRLWQFGDGWTSNVANPTHAYSFAGVYHVTLTVIDSSGASASVTHDVTVLPNDLPHVSFTFSPTAPQYRDVVTFVDTSTDDDGIGYRFWQINDFFSSDPTVAVRACGSLNIQLTVVDKVGQFAFATKQIVVTSSGGIIVVPAGASLADAVASACPGDTFQLEAGEYSGGVTLNDINLIGAGRDATVVTGFGTADDGFVLTAQGSHVTVTDLTVTGGGDPTALMGGGIFADTASGSTRLERVAVTYNTGTGGIQVSCCRTRALEVRDSLITHNTNLSYQYGAGIGMFCCADVTIVNSEIAFNQNLAGSGGGAAPYEADKVVFTGNYVHDNSAHGVGGGLYVASFGEGDLILNNVIVRNHADARAGIASDSYPALIAGNLVAENGNDGIVASAATIVNSTIANNIGRGVASDSPTAIALFNSIVTGNSQDVVATSLGAQSNNIVGSDAGFIGSGDYHLAHSSPAIDAGSNAAVPLELTTDADGKPRVVDGNGDGIATVDIGYVEAPEGWGGDQPNTPVGSPVTVAVPTSGGGSSPVTVTFTSVTTAGSTIVGIDHSGPAPPSGWQLANPATYYNVTTTAVYSGPITVCIDTSGFALTGPAYLLEYQWGLWTNVTDPALGDASHVCGRVGSLAVFAVMIDVGPPVITAPASVRIEATSPIGAFVPNGVLGVAVASDNSGATPAITRSPSGNQFGLGQTIVTWKATDPSSNASEATQLVTVVDTTRPTLTVPGTIEVSATGPATVTYSTTAHDVVDPNPQVTCAPASGSLFPVGTTAVRCTATDASGNSTSASFNVIVRVPAPPGIAQLISFVESLNLPQGLKTSLLAKLRNALAAKQRGNLAAACNLLNAFMNEVNAQSGKQIGSPTPATQLVALAMQIRAAFGCP